MPFTKAAARAISKIRGQLPSPIRRELEKIEDHVAIKLSATNPPESATDVYEKVRTALSHKTVLLCEYDSVNRKAESGKPASRRFRLKPYTLVFNQRAWYVLGHHSKYAEVRCLKLNRFNRMETTTESYTIPKTFSLNSHLGNAWRMIRGTQSHTVELHFDAEFADTISDTHWHSTQEVTWNGDDSITFQCKVDGLDEIVWWILSMGPHCVVKKPKELINQVKALAQAMVAQYPSE